MDSRITSNKMTGKTKTPSNIANHQIVGNDEMCQKALAIPQIC